MNATTDTIRQLAWNGPFGVVVAVLTGLILLALITWSLLRERRILGERFCWLFWVLRFVALGAALWMLLAPSRVTTQRTTIRQSLIVASDVSQSMRTIDESGTADDLRWSIASGSLDQASAILAADQAVVAATIAERRLKETQELLDQHRPEREALQVASAAMQALVHTRSHLQSIASESRQVENSRALLQLLDDEAFDDIARAVTSSESGRDIAPQWRDSLHDAIYNASSLSYRLRRLAQQVRDEQTEILSIARSDELTSLRKLPRLGRVAGAIESLGQDRPTDLNDSAVIKFSVFDSSASQLLNQTAPSEELRRLAVSTDIEVGQITDINASLEQLRQSERDGKLAAIILYTDALNTASTVDPKLIKSNDGTPVYVVPIGNPKHIRDISIQSVMAPSVVMKDDNVVIETDIQAYECAGETCTVELLSDQVTIAHQNIDIEEDVVGRRVRFDTRLADIGSHHFEIRLVHIDGELTDENNSDSFEVNVTRGKIGVLLADQFPRWEYRYLAQLFRRDPKIEADELLFEPRAIATGAREPTKSFPTTVDEWSKYDAVILGDVSSENFSTTSQTSLIEYLRDRGGTLVMIAGSESMPAAYTNQPIASILPVTKLERENSLTLRDGFSFQITERGNRHHALMIGEDQRATQMAWDFINRNAPAGWLSPFRLPRASAISLIAAVPRTGMADEQNAESFLCWQPIGRGRIVYFSGPESYRLRFLRGDRFHYRLWGQLLRWAIAADLSEGNEYVRLRTSKARYDENEAIGVSAELSDISGRPILAASLTATAICDGKPPAVATMSADESVPGRYVTSLQGLMPGEYTLRIDGDEMEALVTATEAAVPTTQFLVRPYVSRERMDTRCDLVMAQQIADATGGQVLPPTAVAEVLKLTNLNPIVTEETTSAPLWIRWELLWLLVGCMSTEWVIRKLKGWS